MKTPVTLVTVTLAVAILLAASFLIATGTRGEQAPASTAAIRLGRCAIGVHGRRARNSLK